jgi:hypothetical protein
MVDNKENLIQTNEDNDSSNQEKNPMLKVKSKDMPTKSEFSKEQGKNKSKGD